MSIELNHISRVLEDIVKTPSYALIGYASGKIVLYSTREGILSLWTLDPTSYGLKRLTREPITGFARPDTDSRYIVFSRDVSRGRELEKLYSIDISGGDEREYIEMEPMRLLSVIHHGRKIVFIGSTMRSLSLYMGVEYGSAEKITDLTGISIVTDFNDKYIVGSRFSPIDPRYTDLFIYDLGTNEYKIYRPRENTNNKNPLLIDTDKVLFESNYTGENKLYIYNIGSGEIEELVFKHRDYYEYKPVEHSLYDKYGEKIWVIGKKDGRTKLFIDGEEIVLPEGTIHGYPVFIDDKVFVALSNITSPPKIYRKSLKENDLEIVVDNKLPDYIASMIAGHEFIRYKSFDGLEIPAYIIYSNTEKPGPAIVYVHGGPWSEVMDSFSRMITPLVAMGYHVIAPNFRGSTGYGDDFRGMDIGDPGGGDLEDIVYAGKYVVEKNIADRDRLAVMGYSYGGYMTYLALGRYPDLWRTGVAGAGIVDWEETYSLSDALFRNFIEILFGGKKELWRERSPITYVDNVKAPICIIHSQNDTRTPLKPVLKYIEKLLEKGNSFETHIVPDTGHAILRIEDAIKILLPALIFLEKYLKKK